MHTSVTFPDPVEHQVDGLALRTLAFVIGMAVCASSCTPTPASRTGPTASRTKPPRSEAGDRQGDARPLVSPLALEELCYIVPLGRVFGDHVQPTDHQYWVPIGATRSQGEAQGAPLAIRSPDRGEIVVLQRMRGMKSRRLRADDYRVVIEHPGGLSSYFIHLKKLAPRIATAYRKGTRRISVSRGEVFAFIGRAPFDFALVDSRRTVKGLVNPESYAGQPWQLHTFDPFGYFPEKTRKALSDRSLRRVPPYGGRIDHDVDGRVVGNWFLDTGKPVERPGSRWDYWTPHLAITYDHIDPGQLRFSIGDYQGKPAQFGVKGNAPDPAGVGLQADAIRYELVRYEYWDSATGRRWVRHERPARLSARNGPEVVGTVLVQLVARRRLKLELFPGKRAAQVEGFTRAARYYRR